MATEIYVISGFLGAGKTTLIQKLLKEAFAEEKVVLIENDFGEISVDAALLKSSRIEVKELNSGCICCSLSGDFVKALKELLERFHPDKIIIEPSGVGKLSDIVKACSDPRIEPLAEVKAKITVADVKRCKMYLDNFGEFFEDQVQNADIVLLSRTDAFPDKIDGAYQLMKSLNEHAAILVKPWGHMTAAEILYRRDNRPMRTEHNCHIHGEGCDHGGGHGHSIHDHDHDCEHDHPAPEVFDTITIRTKRIFSIEDLKARLSNVEQGEKGTVLRVKGIVRGPSGYINLQYIPGDTRITSCDTSGDMLCIIGQDLNRQALCALFGGNN